MAMHDRCPCCGRGSAVESVGGESPAQTTHAEGCWAWGQKHHACAVREIERLRARVAELERDAEEARTKALDEAIEWCRLTEAGDTNEDWQAAARCVRELVEKAKWGTGQDDDEG